MAESGIEMNDVEDLLRGAFERDYSNDDTEHRAERDLMRRAHRRIGARDLMGFGFAHLLTACLVLFAGVHHMVGGRGATDE